MPQTISLTKETNSINHLRRADDQLGRLIDRIGDISYQLSADPYTFLVETVVGQMLSNKVADVLATRLRDACRGNITPQAVSSLAVADFRALGLSNAKAKYILGFTELVNQGVLDFAAISSLPEAEIMKELTHIHGIGSWSAKMYLIFVLGKEDVLPFEDGAFLQSYAWLYQTDQLSKKEVCESCQKWRPYSTTAARYLYRALDLGLTKESSSL